MTETFPSPFHRPASHRAPDLRAQDTGEVVLRRGVGNRTKWIAKMLFENTVRVWPIDIESEDKPFGLTVDDESCALCGGFFPKVGQLRLFYAEDGSLNVVHIGCLVEAGNWLEE